MCFYFCQRSTLSKESCSTCCYYSLSKLCLILCDPVDCSAPGLPVLHRLPELAQTLVHWFGDASQTSHPLSSPSPAFNLSQHQGGQSIGVSASASVLPMNIRGWFPLGLTGLISLLPNGLSRVFSGTIQSINSLVLSLLYGSTLTSIHDYWKNNSFDYILCQQSEVSAF